MLRRGCKPGVSISFSWCKKSGHGKFFFREPWSSEKMIMPKQKPPCINAGHLHKEAFLDYSWLQLVTEKITTTASMRSCRRPMIPTRHRFRIPIRWANTRRRRPWRWSCRKYKARGWLPGGRPPEPHTQSGSPSSMTCTWHHYNRRIPLNKKYTNRPIRPRSMTSNCCPRNDRYGPPECPEYWKSHIFCLVNRMRQEPGRPLTPHKDRILIKW